MLYFIYYYAQCHYAERHYAERHYAECRGADLFYKHIMIVNDDPIVFSKCCSKLWRHFLTTLEVSFMLLDSSIVLLENNHSTDNTHDDSHLRASYLYSTGHK